MFTIDFYEKNGQSPVFEFLEDLRMRKDTNNSFTPDQKENAKNPTSRNQKSKNRTS